MNLFRKKFKLISSVIILLVIFAAGFCGSYPVKAASVSSNIQLANSQSTVASDSQAPNDCSETVKTKSATHGHNSNEGAAVTCCVANAHNSFNKNTNFSIDGKVKFVSSSIPVSETSSVALLSGYSLNDASSSPPLGQRLSSVIKKE